MAEATESQLRAEQLIQDLWNDSTHGATIRAAAKAKFSDIRLPEDQLAPVFSRMDQENKDLREQLGAVVEKLTAREKKEAEADVFQSLKSKVDSAVSEYNLTDDGKAKMLDRMKETGNTSDPEAAAAWVASKIAPVDVKGPTWAPQDINLFGSSNKDEKFASLHRDPQKFMDDELTEFVRNPDKYVAETFAQ